MKKSLIFLLFASILLVLIINKNNLRDLQIVMPLKTENTSETSQKQTIRENFTQNQEQFQVKTNITNQTEGGEGTPGSSSVTGGTSSQQIPSVVSLEIFDLCSGKRLNESFSLSEGGTAKCLNQKPPYFVLIEKNSTHISTSIINVTFFNDVYEANDTWILVYYLYIQDIYSVANDLEEIYFLPPSNYLKLGNYTKHIIWERENGQLIPTKMIAIVPFYVNKNITITQWTTYNFYVRASSKDYSVGNISIMVKEK